ncbi:MAG TPA: response regulator [Blastocatellia bacterium]|nr:response regulator [Blastocatellia bacterium]
MKKILFVDDESRILDGLRRMLRPMLNEWEMAFVTSGAEALETLAAGPFDVVVSDMRMPGMDGAQLLTEVRRHYPEVVRIILSGYTEHEQTLRSLGPVHQFLQKPCDSAAIKETVGRSCALRDLLTGEPLQRAISRMEPLPALPALYLELVDALASPQTATRRVGELIAAHPLIEAKLLEVANSGAFNLPRSLSSAANAVTFLGPATVMALALMIEVFSLFRPDQLPESFSAELWAQSLHVGIFAKRAARSEGQGPELSEEAFVAGLLHRVGSLMLACLQPESYQRVLDLVRAGRRSLEEAELEVFGATQAEVGAYLLGRWGLPTSIVEAVAYHQHPERCLARSFVPLTAVHVGAALDFEARSMPPEQGATFLNLDYLTTLELDDRLPVWQQLCG